MSESGESKTLPEKDIPAITTTSLREITNLFTYKEDNPYLIMEMKAEASESEKGKPDINDTEYGIKGHLDKEVTNLKIDYKVEFDDEGNPRNPIDEGGRDRFISKLDTANIRDASITYFKLQIKDRDIGKRAGIDESKWVLTFESKKPEHDREREFIKNHGINEDLIENQGFKYRILLCTNVVDRKSDLTESASKQNPALNYNEQYDTITTDDELVRYIKENHFGEYKMVKRYGPGEEDTLVVLGVSR